jgi:hypothetical protein
MATGDATAACGTAHGSRGIEALKAKASFCHGIQVRCSDYFIAIEANVTPAEVVAHDEDDVGPVRRQGDHRQPQETNQQSSHVMVSSATAG